MGLLIVLDIVLLLALPLIPLGKSVERKQLVFWLCFIPILAGQVFVIYSSLQDASALGIPMFLVIFGVYDWFVWFINRRRWKKLRQTA